MYVYGFVRPRTGQVQWLFLPTVSTEAFQIALDHFARAVGAGTHKHILLVIDGAGWHVARDLQIPDGLRLVFLPAYSPELQPAERLWPLLHEPLANRAVETMQDLEDCLVERCRYLADAPDELHGRVAYHWWPDDVTAGP